MGSVSNPETPKPKSKSRKPSKKQAVKTTHSAATKAVVQKNASTSILLKAPVEVRDNILRQLLGDRTIHIQYLTAEELASISPVKSDDADKEPARGGLCAAFCMAEKSEQEAYDETKKSLKNSAEDPDYIEPCAVRHDGCLIRHSAGSKLSVEKMPAERLTFDKDLSVLAVCRLLYEESNNILWQTNLFSFDDPRAFRRFNASMNPSQKHKLRKIHLRIDLAIDHMTHDKYRYTTWAKAVVPRILTPLRNLKDIHLSFDQYCPIGAVDPSSSNADFQLQKLQVSLDMESMLGLRLLPHADKEKMNQEKHVTVILSDDPESNTPRWTRAQKLAAAENLRARLVAPNAAEIHIAEEIAAKAAVQEANKRYEEKLARAIIRSLQTSVGILQSEVATAKKNAEDRRADADRWAAEHHHAIEKGVDPAKLMRFHLQSVHCNRVADKAETRYKKLLQRLSNYQNTLDRKLADPEKPAGRYISWNLVDLSD